MRTPVVQRARYAGVIRALVVRIARRAPLCAHMQ